MAIGTSNLIRITTPSTPVGQVCGIDRIDYQFTSQLLQVSRRNWTFYSAKSSSNIDVLAFDEPMTILGIFCTLVAEDERAECCRLPICSSGQLDASRDHPG